ncbi:zinc finger protein 845-like [Limanda limanda]|uniref:zinc finger protein 845-like n=1 Tax=Limanda limanda TaxID=27771 RepID=UPI0029C6B31D|nr:zinc finger protein 845-like [Limanda limanda]
MCTSQEGEQLVLKQETETCMLTPHGEESDHREPDGEHQLLSHNSPVAESQDENRRKHVDSGSTGNEEPNPQKSFHENRSQGINVDNSPKSVINSHAHTELPQQHVCKEEEMSTSQEGEQLVLKQETAAAEMIFTVFEKTIVQYEEEVDRQRRLLESVLKPEIKLHRIELPQQHVFKEEEVLTDQQLCHQERNSSLDQEEQEPPQIKEEQEEMCTNQEGEQLVLKQETETCMLTPHGEESDQNSRKRVDLGSTSYKESNLQKKIHENSSDYVQKSPTSETDSDTSKNKKPLKCIGNFTAHLRIHTGEKPYYKMSYKRLASSSVLDDHMYCLKAAKQYCCRKCGKHFGRMDT